MLQHAIMWIALLVSQYQGRGKLYLVLYFTVSKDEEKDKDFFPSKLCTVHDIIEFLLRILGILDII